MFLSCSYAYSLIDAIVILFYELMLFDLATLLSAYIKQKNPARFENVFPYIKDHRTCKPYFLCCWPSLNSYLKYREFFEGVLYP